MRRLSLGALVLVAMGLATWGAHRPATADSKLAIATPYTPAQIRLPDQRICTYVGPQPRQRALGDPITYDCGNGRGLRGAVAINGTSMTVDREGPENMDRDAIIESQTIRFLIAEIILTDGTVCRFAGEGATLAFDGKRLNYTCGASLGLIGEIQTQAGGIFQVEKAKLNGTNLVSSEMTGIYRLGAAPR
ncbi:MAG TPA: hypothetical protein IGR64_04150 [Leptolyngbyaceae cyanobacterium M65_K2018_010]|nr:hypothetical protein [Leptolyngbyaceae cyanobacterium M65_K2018_010]